VVWCRSTLDEQRRLVRADTEALAMLVEEEWRAV
jgi:hypothetical protein